MTSVKLKSWAAEGDRPVYTVVLAETGREIGVVALLKKPRGSGRWYCYGVGNELSLLLPGSPDPTPHGGPYVTRTAAVEAVARFEVTA